MEIFKKKTAKSIIGAGQVVNASFWSLIKSPHIIVYPIMALIFNLATAGIIGKSIFANWYNRLFSDSGMLVSHRLGFFLGLVSFSVFYAALVSAYFTCAISAVIMRRLDGKPHIPFYGLRQVLKHFWRISRFAVLAVFYFPVGIFVQRRKLPSGWLGVLGSSLTLHMAQVAPAILSTHKSFGETVTEAINTLGRKWQEGLVLKVGIYVMITLFVALPKLIQHGFFSSPKASTIGWIVGVEVAASGLVFFKTLNAIFTTVLYHQAKQQK